MTPRPDHNDSFDEIVENGYNTGRHYTDPNPYGIPANSIPVKPGLTARGKVALGIGAAILATGGLIGYQSHQANENKAQEIALKQQELELEKLREMNRASQINQKTQNSADTARQARIDACVEKNKDLIGKQLGGYRRIVEDCQTQYADTSINDLQTASSSRNTSGGSVNDGVLLGGVVLAGGIYLTARRLTRNPTG